MFFCTLKLLISFLCPSLRFFSLFNPKVAPKMDLKRDQKSKNIVLKLVQTLTALAPKKPKIVFWGSSPFWSTFGPCFDPKWPGAKSSVGSQRREQMQNFNKMAQDGAQALRNDTDQYFSQNNANIRFLVFLRPEDSPKTSRWHQRWLKMATQEVQIEKITPGRQKDLRKQSLKGSLSNNFPRAYM